MADTGGLTAEVIDIRSNQPIPGANAKLGGPVNKEATTGSDGKFAFSDLPPANNYTLDISATGYRTEHYEDIVVVEDNVTNLQKLALWPEE